LGTIYSVCLAELGNKVFAVADTKDFANKLENGETDLLEPKLNELLKKTQKSGKLKFTTDVDVVKNCDLVWITIDTPTNKNNSPDTVKIFKELTQIVPKLKIKSTIVVSSQLPVGTSAKIQDMLPKNKNIGFAYVPENLRLGQSIDNFFNQDRVVVGTNEDKVFTKISRILKDTTKTFIKVNPQTAEVIKHATNAFLATSLSFINDISDICEKVDADVYEVSNALRQDSRIGPKAYLGAGLGFSGVTLERDLAALVKEAKNKKIDLPVISSVQHKNQTRKDYFLNKLKKYIKNLKGKKIGIWGVAYKEGVATLRGSLPIELISRIVKLGVKVKIYGDKTNKLKISNELSGYSVEILEDPYEVAKKVNALLLLSPVTNKGVNFTKLRNGMKSPYLIFDCYNSFYGQEEEIIKSKILYVGVGRYSKE